MNRPDQLKPLNGFNFGKEDICAVIFSHRKTAVACHCFIQWLKSNRNEASRGEVSSFARDLANGAIREGFRYRRENFYRTVLRKLVAFGFISLQGRYDASAKSKRKVRYVYAPVHQPIPKRAPLGGRSFWRLAWKVAKKWNEEFEG